MAINFEGNFTAAQRTEIARIMAENANAGNTPDTNSTVSNVSWLDADRAVITQDDGDVFVLRDLRFLDNPDPNVEDEKNLTANTETPAVTGTLEQQLAALQRRKAENEARLTVLQEQIAELQEKINKEIDEALAKVEGITEDAKASAAETTQKYLDEYAAGKITYEEMQQKIKSDLGNLEVETGLDISGALSNMFSASSNMAILKELVGQMGRLIEENKLLDTQIADLQAQIEAARKAAEAAAAAAAARNTSCDPIGFTVGDITYDFFIDKDGDGALSNENEFLGATNQWAEMQALDTDNDGKVSVQEMIDAGVKVVARDSKTGEQKVMDIADLNMEDIDLSTYSTAKAGDQGNGVNLLGNFNITVDGQTVEGYNTLDTLDYLDKNYDFSDKEKGIGRFGEVTATTAAATSPIGSTAEFEAQYVAIQEQVKELEAKLNKAWISIVGEGTTADVAIRVASAEADLEGAIERYNKVAQERIDASEEIAALRAAETEAAEAAEAEEAAAAVTAAAATAETGAEDEEIKDVLELEVV